MSNSPHAAILILVIAFVTFLLRFLPFFVFSGKRKIPDYILYLGRVLPYAIMGMLVVYCLRQTSFSDVSLWIPQALAAAVVIGLHVWKRNTILSILGGTVLYMVLVQAVF